MIKPAKRENTVQFVLRPFLRSTEHCSCTFAIKFGNTMSELPQSRRMEERSEQVLALGLALGGGRLSRDSEIVHNHTKQIASLRREIEDKDEAISRFNKDLKDLREQNDELKITVESKDEEIKALKEKINKLESDKKTLETKLRSVQAELEAVRKEVDELKEANKISDERNATMDMEVKKLSKKMDGMTQNLEQRVSENSALKKEVKNLREKVQDMASSVSAERMALPFLSDPAVEKASLVLGQLCWRIQAMMYKKVLPNSYDDKTSYKVKHIEEDIEELEDEQQKADAKKRWATLKKKLNWKKSQHTRAMKSIQGVRNDTAHPDLDEQLLVASAKLMEQEGKLTGHHSAARINELIEMWKTLVQLQ